jgi:hypothetical protein
MRRLLLITSVYAVLPFSSLKAQQIEPGETNYYLLSAAFTGGAIISFAVYKNIASCTTDAAYNPTPGVVQTETNCQARDNLKLAMMTVGIGCAFGAIWSLVRGIRDDKFKSTGLLNLPARERGTLRLPDVAYSRPTRDVRVLLVHAVF